MKALKVIGLSVVILLSVTVAIVAYIKYLRPVSKAVISITSIPTADVFINGLAVGTTPYQVSRDAGEIVLKLTPIASSSAVINYETKINLLSGVETIVKRDFGTSEDSSGGEIVSYEKVGKNDTNISLISTPDYAQVVIDGHIRGFSPVLNYSVLPDDHEVMVSKKGYVDRTFSVRTYKGYKSIVVTKLVSTGEPVPQPFVEAGPSPTPVAKAVYIQILDTPSGFLRVRAEGSTTSSEIARVKPGDKLLFVSQNTAGDWYQVVYAEGTNAAGDKKGWIFAQFAKKLN